MGEKWGRKKGIFQSKEKKRLKKMYNSLTKGEGIKLVFRWCKCEWMAFFFIFVLVNKQMNKEKRKVS